MLIYITILLGVISIGSTNLISESDVARLAVIDPLIKTFT